MYFDLIYVFAYHIIIEKQKNKTKKNKNKKQTHIQELRRRDKVLKTCVLAFKKGVLLKKLWRKTQ